MLPIFNLIIIDYVCSMAAAYHSVIQTEGVGG